LYATINEIQAQLPFTLDANSLPTLTYAGTIHENVNSLINGYLGRSSDLSGNTTNLKWVEIDLTKNSIMELHKGKAYTTPVLLQTHIIMLNLSRSNKWRYL